MIRRISNARFPAPTHQAVNMMPFIIGDPETLPEPLKAYLPMIDACGLESTSLAYLTVTETVMRAGECQRRPGIHTEGTEASSWGGHWGGGGVFVASTDGRTRVWDCLDFSGNAHGAVAQPNAESIIMGAETLYQITDRTPHEALPALVDGPRSFFRLVADKVSVWWRQTSTPNPFGVQPNARILTIPKF